VRSTPKSVHGKPFQEAEPPEKLLWKKVNKILKQDCVFGVCVGEATGLGRGGAHPPKKPARKKGQINYLTGMCIRDMRSISLGGELGAIAPGVTVRADRLIIRRCVL